MNSKKQLLDSVNSLIRALEIESQVTLEELLQKVSDLRDKPIIIHSSSQLPATVSGFSLHSSKGCYVIWYDQLRPERNIICIILHELAHILKGDLDGVTPGNEHLALQALCQGKDLAMLQGVACRRVTGIKDERETEVELVALNLMQKVIPVREHQLERELGHWFNSDS